MATIYITNESCTCVFLHSKTVNWTVRYVQVCRSSHSTTKVVHLTLRKISSSLSNVAEGIADILVIEIKIVSAKK